MLRWGPAPPVRAEGARDERLGIALAAPAKCLADQLLVRAASLTEAAGPHNPHVTLIG